MDRWHIGRGGQHSGPYPWAQIVTMARAGQIAPADLLWQEGTTQWLPASTYRDLLPAGPGMPPPPMPVGPPGPPPGEAVKKIGKHIGAHAKRAAEWNLHELQITDEETQELVARGVDDGDARKFHAWRRSVLSITFAAGLVAAILGTITAGISAASHDEQNPNTLTGFGGFIEFLRVVTLWLIPIYARLAGRVWSRHKRSRRLLTIGWTISFAAPLLLALIPVHWRYETGGDVQVIMLTRLGGAIAAYLTLMPAVLALIPGIMRACLRIKILLPQSIVPGWFLVGAAPFWMFLFLVVFVTINQAAGDIVLIFAILAITLAPVLYLVHTGLFTRPILNTADQQRLIQIQRQVRLILSAGVVLLLIWMFTANVFGKRIIGVDENAMLKPWSLDLWSFPIEYLAHSFFTMAMAADIFMAMNLSVWLYTKQFIASPEAAEYDRRMVEINEAETKD